MTTPLSQRERASLCDLAAELGPDAPTLCEGWTAKHLLAHLVVRERRPWAAVGIVVPPLAGLHDREIAKVARQPFEALVRRVREPGLTPFAIAPVDRAANTVEYFVHHEDLRRAQPSWEPRELAPGDQASLWGMVKGGGRMLVRRAGVPVTVREPGGRAAVLRSGAEPVTVRGPVPELLLFLYGRKELRGLTFDGPAERIQALRQASLGV